MQKLVVDEDGLQSIVSTSLSALLKASSRKHKELRAEAEAALKRLTEEESAISAGTLRVKDEGRADAYFLPFYLALDSGVGKMQATALDAVARLFAGGHLVGLGKASASQYPSKATTSLNADGRLLVNVIVDACLEAALVKEAPVQLGVIRCLLTGLSSVSCPIHDQALLVAIIALYTIYLAPADDACKVTAKATLTQVHQLIFARMEHFGQQLRQLETTYTHYVQHRSAGQHTDTNSTAATAPTSSTAHKATSQSSSAGAGAVANGHAGVSASASSSTSTGARGRSGVCCVCRSPADHFCSQTRDPVCSLRCKLLNLDVKDPQMKSNAAMRTTAQRQLLAYERDAFLLLRSLLKLAHRALPVPADATAADSKLVSFHLLLSVLNHAGPIFRTSPPFVSLVKGDLADVLQRNSAGTGSGPDAASIFSLSSSIFVAMVSHFKPHMHAIIGRQLESIYLPYIAAASTSFDLKLVSLTVISRICADPATLLELFINFDCSLDNYNTFQKIVATLEKASQPSRAEESAISREEEKQLREVALRALVSCMKVLVHWTTRRTAMKAAEQQSAAAAAAAADQGANDSDDEGKEGGPQSPVGDERTATSSPPPSVPNSASSSSLDKFQLQRQQKQRFDTGVFKFNSKPKAGVKFLQEHQLVGSSAEAVAHFFHTHPGLDKTAIGEYMGDEAAYNKQVMYAYVEQMRFEQMQFDEGIRHFVSGFRLPGEAQKIDRMMEKFAEQYHQHNPGMFSSADTAYVLAYSVILLNSDAHNPQVKKRMTKEEFFRNCKGIDNGSDIDPAFLADIYDRITTNEIRMKADSATTTAGGGGSDMKRSTSLDPVSSALGGVSGASNAASPTSDSVVQSIAERNGTATAEGGGERTFYLSSDSDFEVVKPMFEILWFPALATFSMILEESDLDVWVDYCLDGYRLAIKVSNELELDTARLAFVSSLRKFTLLGSSKEMKTKNLAAVKVLLTIAHQDGNRLKESWIDILQSVSEVERLHLVGAARPDGDVFAAAANGKAGGGGTGGAAGGGGGRLRESDSVNSLAIHRIDAAAIDRVFTSSANLDERAIIDFVMALRQISEVELSNAQQPRVFALQKIVEITSYNMGRIRLVWNRIWVIISEYFIKAGCHPNLQVSIFAIDSVRQLAMKFLEKDELASYQFQKAFFKPFEMIMLNNPSPDTRELIVQCLQRMIASKVHNIRSGWKAVFVVLGIAAKQSTPPLVHAAFELLQQIMDLYFALITESSADTLDECVNCLVAFGCNPLTDIAHQAIARLQNVADFLGQQVVQQQQIIASGSLPPGHRKMSAELARHSFDPSADRAVSDNSSADATTAPASAATSPRPLPLTPHSSSVAGVGGAGAAAPPSASTSSSSSSSSGLRIWFLLLTGLSRLVGDSRLAVRSAALEGLFAVLNKHGALFSAATWRHIFYGVLFPIFDDVRHAGEADIRSGGASNLLAVATPVGSGVAGAKLPSSSSGGAGAESSWLQTTCYAALFTLVELFHRFHVSVNFLLPELLSLISSCIDGDSDDLAKIGLKCLVVLCSTCGPQLSVQSWWLVLDSVMDVLRRLQPHHLQSNDTRQLLGLPPLNDPAFQAALRKGSKGQPDLIATAITAPPDLEATTTTTSTQPQPHSRAAHTATAPTSTQTPPSAAQPGAALAGTTPTSGSIATTRSSQTPVDGAASDGQQQPQQPEQRAAAADSTSPPPTAPSAVSAVPSSASVASSAAVAVAAPPAAAAAATGGAGAASPSAPPPPPSLPFTSASIGVRSRTSLLLMDSLYEVVLKYFPQRPNDADPLPPLAPSLAAAALFPAHVDPFHSPIHTAESVAAAQAAGSTRFTYHDATAAQSTPAALEADDVDWSSQSSSLSPSVSVKRPIDRRVLGHLTCAQLFYALDILHSSVVFSHRFNADLTLRRKLFAAGLILFEQSNRLPQLFASEAHALQITVLLLATMYKAGVPHLQHSTPDTRQPPSFLREPPSSSIAASSGPPPASLPHVPHLHVSTAALSPSSSLESVAALRVLDRADFDCSCWESERRLFALMASLFTVYLSKVRSGQLSAVESSDEVCVAFIDQFSSLPSPQFAQHLPEVWQPIVDLVEHAQTAPLRASLRRFFISSNVASRITAPHQQ